MYVAQYSYVALATDAGLYWLHAAISGTETNTRAIITAAGVLSESITIRILWRHAPRSEL